jgi:hypothetical protein
VEVSISSYRQGSDLSSHFVFSFEGNKRYLQLDADGLVVEVNTAAVTEKQV